MESFKIWILSVCVFSVVLSLYKLLLPEGNIKRAGETVFSLLLLMVMVSPLMQVKNKDFSFHFTASDIFSEQAAKAEVRPYKEAVEKAVSDALSAKQIEHNEVLADMNIENETNIIINNIFISVKDGTDEDTVRQAIAENTMISADVITITR